MTLLQSSILRALDHSAELAAAVKRITPTDQNTAALFDATLAHGHLLVALTDMLTAVKESRPLRIVPPPRTTAREWAGANGLGGDGEPENVA
jgi:hypothetical protein